MELAQKPVNDDCHLGQTLFAARCSPNTARQCSRWVTERPGRANKWASSHWATSTTPRAAPRSSAACAAIHARSTAAKPKRRPDPRPDAATAPPPLAWAGRAFVWKVVPTSSQQYRHSGCAGCKHETLPGNALSPVGIAHPQVLACQGDGTVRKLVGWLAGFQLSNLVPVNAVD